MSRRDFPIADRYDERESEFYRRPRRDRDYDDLEVDITRERGYPESRRAETVVRERDRDTVISGRRGERGPRQPDFLRDDYGKSSTAGELVIREERDEDTYSRAPTRRRSVETVRSRAPERESKEKIIIEERERDRGPLPYPRSGRSEVDYKEKDEEIIFRERTRSRPPPQERSEEKIDISIRRDERESRPPPPRSEIRERDVEEIRFRRGGGDRPGPRLVEREEIDIRESRSPAPPPPRSVVNREEIDIDIRERRSSPRRGREVIEEKIDIRESSRPAPRRRSQSRGALVARKEEEWVVRRPRTPPPRDYEKEEIIIRRKERTPSPEPPPREPTPEPVPPPLEPIYRPPIIQEYITHHRHIDHGVERARSPTPPPAPAPPSPPKEDNLEIEIKRKGVRNGKAFEEDLIIEENRKEGELGGREVSRPRSVSRSTRHRSPSPVRRRYYDDEVSGEAEYYNRKVSSRAYPGEAYNGATRDWGIVDVPPGTERVRMDGIGGGAQEIYWQRYNGERKGRFITNDRAYESEFGNGYSSPPPLPAPREREREDREVKEEIKITETRTSERERERPRKRDKMWTEVTKDLVIKEAIEESGYSYEETNDHFYIIEYLRYEDVLRLVEITEDIKKERRDRIREIQWEREESERQPKLLPAPPPIPAPPRSRYDERIYEREYIYDRDGRRRR